MDGAGVCAADSGSPVSCQNHPVRSRSAVSGPCDPGNETQAHPDPDVYMPCSNSVNDVCGPLQCEIEEASCECDHMVWAFCCPPYEDRAYCISGTEVECDSLCGLQQIMCPPDICHVLGK